MRFPLISQRISFRWLPDPPAEATSTLVLTSPTGYFVDVRIFNAPKSSETPLQWAFAGTSVHDTVNGQSHGTWVHLVDSKHPSGFKDSGTFKDLPNGDSLEVGVMHDDDLGVVREYEEVWRDWAADPPDFVVSQALGEGAQGYYIRMAQYAQGVVKDEAGRLGVSRWVKGTREWTKDFTYGEIHEWLPSPASANDNRTLSSSGPCRWVIVEEPLSP